MKKLLLIIVILSNTGILFSQSRIQRVYEIRLTEDSIQKKLIQENIKNESGKIIIEKLYGIKPMGNKWERNGEVKYKYDKGKLVERFYSNPVKGDTIVTYYQYRGRKVIIRKKELITESKIKDGLVYGGGTPNGCVVPPEALDYYKVWLTRQKKKSIYKKGRKEKDKVTFDYRTNPNNVEYLYDLRGRLQLEKQISRHTKKPNWIRTYRYFEDRIEIKRKFFIEYWSKIPPSENEIHYLDKENRVVKIEMKNMKDKEDCIIEKEYNDKGEIQKEKLFTFDKELLRVYEYEY